MTRRRQREETYDVKPGLAGKKAKKIINLCGAKQVLRRYVFIFIYS